MDQPMELLRVASEEVSASSAKQRVPIFHDNLPPVLQISALRAPIIGILTARRLRGFRNGSAHGTAPSCLRGGLRFIRQLTCSNFPREITSRPSDLRFDISPILVDIVFRTLFTYDDRASRKIRQ